MKSGCFILGLVLAGAVARAEEMPLKIDAARSRVEIEVKATADSFVGKLENYEVAVTVDPKAGEVRGARFGFHFSDVKTGKADRDEQMHAWQDTPHHPDGGFALGSLTRNEDGGLTATGVLTLHGMAREISFPASVSHEGGLFAIDGDAAIDTRDFGLPVIKKFLLLKVDPEVHVRFHLQGRAEEAATNQVAENSTWSP